MRIPGCLFFAVITFSAAAQVANVPQVPHKMQFAGMTLTIRDDARREIQKDVDALRQSPRHFNIKVERAKTYFPLIEKVFREEGVPEDFKFLVIQESALIADAVSVSNAVGFWQFKDFTALEMGLRVDKEIDERLNIVSSSRAAARYIKKNNTFFDNWLYALQAYQMGAGGVLRSVPDSQSGVQNMEITSKTYWYVKKYLAHKVAFEDAVKGVGQIQVFTYETQKKKTLTELAREVTVDEAELVTYNKWTKSGSIPDDKVYAVLIPMKGNQPPLNLPEPVASTKPTLPEKKGEHKTAAVAARKEGKKKINGILVIEANEGETPTRLAARAGIDLSMFLKWNDISISDRIKPGDYYMLGKKRARADQAYHKVQSGETLWDISQRYGLQMKKLKKYNRIDSDADLKAGMTLYLASAKPRNSDNTVAPTEVVEVDKSDTFSWTPDVVTTPVENTVSPAVISTAPVIVVSKPDSVSGDAVPVSLPDSTVKIDSVAIPAADTTAGNTIVVVIPEKTGEHMVKQGETLYAIAKLYNIGVMDLVNWNKLNLQDGIRPGQVLKTVESAAVQESVVTTSQLLPIEHEVKATDTLYGIARKYNVTIKELMEWNNKKDFTLTVGEKLKVNPRQ